MADVRLAIAADPELAQLWDLYLNGRVPDDLEAVNRTRLQMLANNFFGAFEDAYFAREYGILGDPEWERIQRAACQMLTLSDSAEVADIFVSPEFREFLDSTC